MAAPQALNLRVDVRVSAETVAPGETVEYLIRYRCASLVQHCHAATINNVVPSEMKLLRYHRTGGQIDSVAESDNTIVWGLKSPGKKAENLRAGSSGIIKMVARFPVCGGGALSGMYSNVVEFSAESAATVSDTADVTLTSDVPDCPTAVNTRDLQKKNAYKNVGVDGFGQWNLIVPATGSVYTLTDNIPNEVTITAIDRHTNELGKLETHIQCANSGVWHKIAAGSGNKNLTKITHLPAADECVGTDHPDNAGTKLLNITNVRFVIPDTITQSQKFNNAIRYYMFDDDVFSGVSVNLPNGSTGDARPNWVAPIAGGEIKNCVQSSDTSIGDNGESCVTTIVDLLSPAPRLTKAIVGAPDQPFDSATAKGWPAIELDENSLPPRTQGTSDLIYGIRMRASSSMGDWVDPVLVDLLDENLEYVPYPSGTNWWHVAVDDDSSLGQNPYENPACHTPSFSMVEDFNGTGRTLLRWSFDGCTIPAQSSVMPDIHVFFSTRIKTNVTSGTMIPNMGSSLIPFSESPHDYYCRDNKAPNAETADYWPDSEDVNDLDGDGVLSEMVCPSNVLTYTVPTITMLDSSKWVKGALDSEFSRYPITGDTNISGTGTYEIFIENSGNINVTQLDVVDFMPYNGDTSVTIDDDRNSAWGTQIAAEIAIERSADAGNTWANVPSNDLLYGKPVYGTTNDPCVFDRANPNGDDISITGSHPNGCTPFSQTLSADGALSFGFRFQPASALAPGEMIRVTLPVKLFGNPPGCDDPLCVGDTITNTAIAWNSFAFGGTYEDGSRAPQSLLDTEPIKVGLSFIDTNNYTSLGNLVWNDANGNGLQEATELPIVGVTVSLYIDTDCDGMPEDGNLTDADALSPIGQMLTDNNGFYRFDGISVNSCHVVRLDNDSDYTGGPLAGLSLTQQYAGDTLLDSNAYLDGDNYPTINAAVDAVTGSEDSADPAEYPSFDFGFWQPASLGDYVWFDTDSAGDQGDGFPVTGMSITLWQPGPDGLANTADDVQLLAGADGVLDTADDDVAPFVTLANGAYEFSNLPEGSYFVRFDVSTISGVDPLTGVGVNSAEWTFTAASATGDPLTDSNVDSAGYTGVVYLSTGEHNPSIDAGIKPVPVVASPVSIGNYVWEDTTPNDVQDNAEPAVAGVRVDLLDNSGVTIDTTFTDGNGYYQFDNLNDGDTYELIFTPPTGFSLVTANVGSDINDSDASATTGSTGQFTVSPTAALNASDPDATATLDSRWDAGLIGTMSLGNLVWNDDNNNGTLDVGESGIENVTVWLYDAVGATRLMTTTTDSNGKYLFSGLAEGQYLVEVEIPSSMTSSDDIASSTTPQNGTDSDDNGVDLTSQAGFVRSNVIALTFGSGSLSESDHGQAIDGTVDSMPDRNANYTLDFGFYFIGYDYGDLPDTRTVPSAGFLTLLENDGARHALTSDLYLGGCVDAEKDGDADFVTGLSTGSGDDNTLGVTGRTRGTCVGNDDEDGVVLVTPLVADSTACVAVSATVPNGNAHLNGWIDFNGDGDFDAADQLSFTSIEGVAVVTTTNPTIAS
ncbi:MAG: SdrD B-like domain-containing protein, partial [Candidatus Promineifilaceae bacterium]